MQLCNNRAQIPCAINGEKNTSVMESAYHSRQELSPMLFENKIVIIEESPKNKAYAWHNLGSTLGKRKTRKDKQAVEQPPKKKSKSTAVKICEHCEINKTPLWRKGPEKNNIQVTLCNACGLYYHNALNKLLEQHKAQIDELDKKFSNKKVEKSIDKIKINYLLN